MDREPTHKRLLEAAGHSANSLMDHDFDETTPNLVIVDSASDTNHYAYGKEYGNRLMLAITRYLAQDLGLPTLALKCGSSALNGFKQHGMGTLEPALNALNAGVPLLLLDHVERPTPR